MNCLEYCFDEQSGNRNHSNLMEEFLQTVPDAERDLLEKALRYYKEVEDNSYEEFLDVLDAHEVRAVVTSSNYKEILSDVAHAELIQEPAFIAERWRPVFVKSLKPILQGNTV